MSSPSDTLKKFAAEHNLRVIDSNKRAYKHTRANVQLFHFADDYNKFLSDHITYETETLYTVEIAESELERIAEFESQVFNNLKQTGHYRLFETLMEQKEQEVYLRDKYPAVNKAYQQYSLMLKLAQSGEL
jgi:hemerythrin-like domain-containing protein